MKRNPIACWLCISLIVLAGPIAIGCSATVHNLEPETVPANFRPADPYELSVGVAPLNPNRETAGWEAGLAEFLRDQQIFAEVVHPYTGRERVDLVLRARIQPRWRPGGVANFFTYFPGGLLLVPQIRGVRWTYDTEAIIEVEDAHTKEKIARYQAETSHRLVHRSTSPGPFFGALIVVPAIISGAKATRPRTNYSGMMYEAAHADLWRQVGGKIVADSSDYVLAEQRALTRSTRVASRLLPSFTRPVSNRPATRPASATRVTTRHPSDLYSRRVGVVVGIDHYDSYPDLAGANADARRMATFLRGEGFDPVFEIYDDDASRQRLLKLLGNELPAAVDSESLALIYFAGHGETETLPGGAKRGYLIPSDTDANDVFSTGISMETVRHLSKRMTAKHVLYAIDACYSGLALSRGIAVHSQGDDYLRKLTSLPAVQILTAGSEGEQAVEIGGQGLFTTYLLRGLQGEADLDGDGAVTATEVGAFLKPQVTRASGSRQTPQFGTIDGTGDVVFLPGR